MPSVAWFRVIFLAMLALGLAGCMLQSGAPLFGEAEARLLLADYPNPVVYQRDDGGWKKSEEQVSFSREASHYLMTPDNAKMQLYFVPLDGPWWILQATETSGATYVLAKAEAKQLLVFPLDCKTLEDSGKYRDAIAFTDSSCTVKGGADKLALFKSLTADPGEPATKLVSEP